MSVKLLKDLNFAEKINATDAITEAGKEMLSNYRAYIYANPATCGLVNGFVAEASKYSFDTGLANILESVNSFINENNISWKLASACESINNNNSTYNYIAKLGVAQVQKLLEMNESDVVSYIKAGSLKNIQYIPEFRQICKEVYKTHITEAQAPNYTVINPVSYVYVSESKDQYFNVLGRTFKISGNKVNETVCEDATFNKINKILESFTKDGDDIYVELRGAHGDVSRFSINESELTFTNGKINEQFEDAVSFREYCNNISKMMNVNEKLQFMNVSSAVADVFENSSNIILLNNVKLLSAANGTVCAIVEAKDNVNLTVFRSINSGTSSHNYDYVVEALNSVIKLTGIDLRNLFEDRINEDAKKLDPEAQEIKEQLEANKDAQIAIRKKKIAMLAESVKNDPAKIMILNKIAKDLKMLEND